MAPQEERRKTVLTKEELVEAISEGFVRALNTPQAAQAVEGAVTAWFDRQSGKAVRRMLNSLAVGAILLLATNFDGLKAWFHNLGK